MIGNTLCRKDEPQVGDTRVIGKFHWLPCSIKRVEEDKMINESRWLEYAEVKQEFQEVEYWEHYAGGFRKYLNFEWVNTEWVKDEEDRPQQDG
jgi:hypothetical protein